MKEAKIDSIASKSYSFLEKKKKNLVSKLIIYYLCYRDGAAYTGERP
jgi:hypothetical protein